MSCVSVCAYAAQANPVGAVSKTCERVVGSLGGSQSEASGARGCGEGALGSLFQRIPFGASATTALLPAGSCWVTRPLCGEA